MATTYAISNQKGGVWKTSTTINLGAALAAMGKRVLLVDMDPSGDLTTHAGIDLEDGDATIYEVLTGDASLPDAVRHVEREETGTSYDLVPADAALADLPGEKRAALRDVLTEAAAAYDVVLIDTPPSVGVPIVAAMAAADALIIPAMPSLLSLSAVNAVTQTVQDVRSAGLNPGLKIAGVILTDYRARSVHHRDVAAAMRDALPGALYDTTISNAVAAVEAAASGTDVFAYVETAPKRRKTPVLDQYRHLAAEIMEREAAEHGTE